MAEKGQGPLPTSEFRFLSSHERTDKALTVSIVSRSFFRPFLGKCENLFNCWKSSYHRFNEATVNIVKWHYALNERHKVLAFVETWFPEINKRLNFVTFRHKYVVHSLSVVMSVVDKYHLIPTPIFSSFKPPSAQKKNKILKRSTSYYFKKLFQLDNHKSCIISKSFSIRALHIFVISKLQCLYLT